MSNIIEVKNISKAYGDLQVISGLSLSFEKGTVTCLMGSSGCGKTTLLRILAGLETPDSGIVERLSDSLSYVFQEDRLSENYSAFRNIRLVTGRRMHTADINKHLEEIGLGDFINKKVSKFSGGMKRRVAIARAICYDADILLMDEPFKGLDPMLKTEVMDYVKRHTEGKTVIYVTHDEAESEYMGGKVIELKKNY